MNDDVRWQKWQMASYLAMAMNVCVTHTKNISRLRSRSRDEANLSSTCQFPTPPPQKSDEKASRRRLPINLSQVISHFYEFLCRSLLLTSPEEKRTSSMPPPPPPRRPPKYARPATSMTMANGEAVAAEF